MITVLDTQVNVSGSVPEISSEMETTPLLLRRVKDPSTWPERDEVEHDFGTRVAERRGDTFDAPSS